MGKILCFFRTRNDVKEEIKLQILYEYFSVYYFSEYRHALEVS